MLPERIRLLRVGVGGADAGNLTRESQFVVRYGRDDGTQHAIGLLMPPSMLTFASDTMFPVMDQKRPDGRLTIQEQATRSAWKVSTKDIGGHHRRSHPCET